MELRLADQIDEDTVRPVPTIDVPASAAPRADAELQATLEAVSVPPPLASEGSLVFKEHLERLSEVLLILLVGGMLFVDSWSWRAVGFAAFLFVLVRPLSVLLGMAGSGAPWRMRGLVGWFGVRGIGSLYYLMFVIQHGLPEPLALQLIQLTLVVITLSVLAHGASAKPLMTLFWRN